MPEINAIAPEDTVTIVSNSTVESADVHRCQKCGYVQGAENPDSPPFVCEEAQLVLQMRTECPNWYGEVPSVQVRAIGTIIRDKRTKAEEFVFYSDRLIRLLIERSLDLLPFERCERIETPVGDYRSGVRFTSNICGVSIVRAGESMEAGLRAVCRGCHIGKILIQRDEETLESELIYTKLPKDIATRKILLLEPLLATGGSAICALDTLVGEHGVRPENIIFVNLVACPMGVRAVSRAYPQVKIVSTFIDPRITVHGWIDPGIGDFGDRYFGTTQ